MTTYSKETSLFDTGAIATDINEAGQTADRYITYVDADTGIQVHNAEDDDNYVQLNSYGMEVFQDNASVAMFGSEARIGPLNDAEKVVIGNGGVSMYTSDNAKYFESYVDDVNPKIIQIEYNLDSPIISKDSGTDAFNIPSQSVGITEMISASGWNAVSNGNTFSIMIGYGEFPPYKEVSEEYTGSFTKGIDGSFTKTYTRSLGGYFGVRTVTCTVNYNSSNDTISFSGNATYTGPAHSEWEAFIDLYGIIYPKQVPWPKVKIDGSLICTDEIIRKMDDIDTESTPSTDHYTSYVEMRDVNDINASYLGLNHTTDGKITTNLGVHRVVNDSDIYHTFGLSIDSSGNKYFDSPISTSVSGSTGALHFYRWGNIVYVSSNGAFRSKSTSIASGTTLTQKIPSGYKPVAITYVSCAHSASNNWRLEFYSNGNIAFLGSAAWNANMWISGMWMTADPLP